MELEEQHVNTLAFRNNREVESFSILGLGCISITSLCLSAPDLATYTSKSYKNSLVCQE